MHKRLDTEALGLLRMCFDLAEADLRPSADLLERLLDVVPARLAVLTIQLRRARLMQPGTFGLTMAGLVLATRLPQAEPEPMVARRRADACAA